MNQLSQEQMIQEIATWIGAGSINIFGMQFSGKDTQGEHIARLLDAPLFGGGDILRNSVIPQSAQKALADGLFIDSHDYLEIVTPYFNKPEFNNKPLVLSSVGRWIGEEATIIRAAESSGHPIKAVIYLKIDESEAFRRMELADRGRDDDHHENLTSRIKEFKNKTVPVVHVYRSMGLLVEIDASSSPSAVLSAIIEQLYRLSKQSATQD